MARSSMFEHYHNYAFGLEAPDGSGLECRFVWSDPFQPATLWICRAHIVERETLDQWFRKLGDHRQFLVHMYATVPAALRTKNRTLSVTFESHEWLPLDLNLEDTSIAYEAIKLSGVRYELHIASH